MEYLDDKLGHPLLDPHGAAIPPDVTLAPGVDARVSKLREGHRGKIVEPADVPALQSGAPVSVGPRSKSGDIWTLVTDEGKSIALSHDQADQVVVRLE